MDKNRLYELGAKKMRYAIGGAIATGVDYLIYFALFNQGVNPVAAQMVAYPVSVLVNFVFQRLFVFELNRPLGTTFALSMMVSAGGLALSSGLIYLFNLVPLLHHYQLLTKLMTSGIVFFYNFYCKRYVFEKRFY
ncbi:MAG: GtrA family protein [Saprospiraceae bacterium]